MSSTMKAALVLVALLLLAQVLELCAFLPNNGGARVTTTNALFRTSSLSSWRHLPSIGHQTDAHSFHLHGGTISSTELYSSSNSNDGSSKQKKKKGLDENLRNKLVTESIAPWRTVRLFLYFSCGSGALIGGLITLTGFVAALSNGNENLVVNTELTNLAIDFGAVAIFAALAKWDLDKQGELGKTVQEKVEKKREQTKLVQKMKEREMELATLSLEIQVSADGTTKEAAVRDLQAGARQHMIIVIGPRKACRNALIGANLLKMDFAMSNVLVVPYETDKAEVLAAKPSGGGFGEQPMYETQPYVARPVGDGWHDYAKAELADAVAQSGPNVKEEGIAIVVANTGKVIRRGVGKVPWRQMVEQLATEESN